MRVMESQRITTSIFISTRRRARSSTTSAIWMWFSAVSSELEAMTSPFSTERRKSVTSSGRSSTSSTITRTSG